MQIRSSRNTDVNGRQGKLPALYTNFTFPYGATVIDYGCGRITTLLEQKAKEDGANWYGYDLFWKPDQEVLSLLDKGVDLAVCSNVLNVIDDFEVVKEIISRLINGADRTIIQIYQGNGTGIGCQGIDADSWQRNEKISVYKKVITDMGYTLTKEKGKSNFIIVDKEIN